VIYYAKAYHPLAPLAPNDLAAYSIESMLLSERYRRLEEAELLALRRKDFVEANRALRLRLAIKAQSSHPISLSL
jgi:hypothetical protein